MTPEVNDHNDSREVLEELKAASAKPRLTPRELVQQQPKFVRTVMQLVFAQWRPLLSFLYNASRDARKLLADSKAKWELRPPALKPDESIAGLIAWIQNNGIDAFNHLPFQLLQEASANVYAAILLFECDKLVRQVKKTMDAGDREAGPAFSGEPFSRILRAAGNQYRHGNDWPDVSTLGIEDARVLTAIGVTDVRAVNAQAEILAIVGGSGYFDFEENLLATITELLQNSVKE